MRSYSKSESYRYIKRNNDVSMKMKQKTYQKKANTKPQKELKLLEYEKNKANKNVNFVHYKNGKLVTRKTENVEYR